VIRRTGIHRSLGNFSVLENIIVWHNLKLNSRHIYITSIHESGIFAIIFFYLIWFLLNQNILRSYVFELKVIWHFRLNFVNCDFYLKTCFDIVTFCTLTWLIDWLVFNINFNLNIFVMKTKMLKLAWVLATCT
jgi:hypothetical protein